MQALPSCGQNFVCAPQYPKMSNKKGTGLMDAYLAENETFITHYVKYEDEQTIRTCMPTNNFMQTEAGKQFFSAEGILDKSSTASFGGVNAVTGSGMLEVTEDSSDNTISSGMSSKHL